MLGRSVGARPISSGSMGGRVGSAQSAGRRIPRRWWQSGEPDLSSCSLD